MHLPAFFLDLEPLLADLPQSARDRIRRKLENGLLDRMYERAAYANAHARKHDYDPPGVEDLLDEAPRAVAVEIFTVVAPEIWSVSRPDASRYTSKLEELRNLVSRHCAVDVATLEEKWRDWVLRDHLPAEEMSGQATGVVKMVRQEPTDVHKGETIEERAGRRRAVVIRLLNEKGWTPGKLATKSGVGKATVYEYLNGTRRWISANNRKAIAEELGIAIENLPE